jgi:hypothetical protein
LSGAESPLSNGNVQIPGTPALVADATEDDGNLVTSEAVSITVIRPNTQATANPCFIMVHQSDFESDVPSQWSSQFTEVTPAGARRFLGLFGNDTIRLGLTNLPPHAQARITFDLYLKDSWDGNEVPPIGGPDHWMLAVENGPTLLDTTFSLLPDFCDCQAYPDNYPDGNHPGRTGAVENNTLGYTFEGRPMDAVYHFSFTFPHTGESVAFDFLANRTSPTTADESWGIDNVSVEVDATSAPEIVNAPAGKTVAAGSDALFAVEAKYASTYQWLFQGAPLAGATNATLLVSEVQSANAGDYQAVVSNCAGSTISQIARLGILQSNEPPTISRIDDRIISEETATGEIPRGRGRGNAHHGSCGESRIVKPSTRFRHKYHPGGTAAARTLVATPATNQFGESTITVTVSDTDGASARSSFKLTVQPVNDPPTVRIAQPPDRSAFADQTRSCGG